MTTGPSSCAELANALLETLAGRDVEAPLPPYDLFVERLSDPKDLDAVQLAMVRAQSFGLRRRLEGAIKADQIQVNLDDGSHLKRLEVERKLAEKEEKGVYLPLRERLEDALGEARFDASEIFDDQLSTFGLGLFSGIENLVDEQSALTTFLAAGDDLVHEVKSALSVSGGLAVIGPRELERALDLPNNWGAFTHDVAHELTRVAKGAAAPFLQRELKRVKAPADLAGLVVSAVPGPVRMLTAEARRHARYFSLLLGAGKSLALAVVGEGEPALDDAARLMGRGLCYGLTEPELRQRHLGGARHDAEQATQIGRCTTFLRARAYAAASLSLLENGENEDALQEGLEEALGVNPGPHLGAWLLSPEWPGGPRLQARGAGAAHRAWNLSAGAAVAMALRERFDAGFPVVKDTYEWLHSQRDALQEGPTALAQELGISLRDPAPLCAWVAETL